MRKKNSKHFTLCLEEQIKLQHPICLNNLLQTNDVIFLFCLVHPLHWSVISKVHMRMHWCYTDVILVLYCVVLTQWLWRGHFSACENYEDTSVNIILTCVFTNAMWVACLPLSDNNDTALVCLMHKVHFTTQRHITQLFGVPSSIHTGSGFASWNARYKINLTWLALCMKWPQVLVVEASASPSLWGVSVHEAKHRQVKLHARLHHCISSQ